MADVAGALDLLDRMITQDRERRALADDLARGRHVPGWLVTIEARLAAGDAVEAARRTSYPLLPLARFGTPAGGGRDVRLDLRPLGTVSSLEAKVEELTEADVDSAEADRLGRAYPTGINDWQDLQEGATFSQGLRAAAWRRFRPQDARLTGLPQFTDPGPLGEAPDRFWRAVWQIDLLADDYAQAHARAAELATTLVDWAGRPIGRVLAVKPDPAPDIRDEDDLLRRWWDYDDVTDPGTLAASARGLLRHAAEIAFQQRLSIAEAAQLEPRMHHHADGGTTLSSPQELAVAADQAKQRATDAPTDELRRLAVAADAEADGILDPTTDDGQGLKAAEQLRHQAAVYRQLADDATSTP